MTGACVTDAAVVTAFGGGIDTLWRSLMEGQSAIRPVHRFRADVYSSGVAAIIDDLDDFEISAGGGAKSLAVCLLERLLQDFGPVPSDSRLLTATTKGAIDTLERWRRDGGAKPLSIPALGITTAGLLGLGDGGVNVSAACASSTAAVAWAVRLIESGEEDSVVVVSMDIVSEFVFSGFAALKALSATPCRPFDRERDGLSLGEGAAAILLMSAERARREGRDVVGTILGGAVVNDANHITAPARDASGLKGAVRLALKNAGVDRSRVAAISAHGTGTVYNDCMELTAFADVFGDRRIPVSSIKGAVGHTLGAAGGIEVALCLNALAEGLLPPTVGCDRPEELAEGRVSATAAPFDGDYLLSTNSGFGGVNAALVLGRR